MAVDPIPTPSNATYGTVVFQGAGIHIDQGDADTDPDFDAVAGTATFTASKLIIRDVSASPNPITLYPRPVVGSLGADGYLTTPDGSPSYPSVRLVATDNPDYGPFLWRVDFALLDAFGQPIAQPGFWFELDAGTTVDLTSVPRINPVTGLPENQAVWLLTTTASFAADIVSAPVGAYLWNTDTDDVVRKDS